MFAFVHLNDSVLSVRIDLSKHWWVALIAVVLLLALIDHFLDYRHTVRCLHKVITQLRSEVESLRARPSESEKTPSVPNPPAFLTKPNPYFSDKLRQGYLNAFETTRLDRALSSDATVPQKIELTAIVPSFTKPHINYHTSLKRCTCEDHSNRHTPCKHMLRLALFVGATYDMNQDVVKRLQQLVDLRNTEQSSQAKRSPRTRKPKKKGK